MNESLGIVMSKEFQDFLKQQTDNFNRSLIQATDKLVEVFGRQLSQQMDDFYREFGESFRVALEQVEADAEKIGSLLSQANLWIPPSATMDLLRGLKSLAGQKNVTSEDMKQFFVEYYEQGEWYKLRLMVSPWKDNPYFTDRMYIIEDALDAHVSGKYTLVIPALLSQIEGIFSSILEKPAGSTTGLVREAIKDEHSEFLKAASKDILIKFATSPAGYGGVRLEHFTSEKFPEWLRTKGLSESQSLNRHSILHGIQINYASKENSLRTFLLLDVAYYMRRKEWDKKFKWVLDRHSH